MLHNFCITEYFTEGTGIAQSL